MGRIGRPVGVRVQQLLCNHLQCEPRRRFGDRGCCDAGHDSITIALAHDGVEQHGGWREGPGLEVPEHPGRGGVVADGGHPCRCRGRGLRQRDRDRGCEVVLQSEILR